MFSTELAKAAVARSGMAEEPRRQRRFVRAFLRHRLAVAGLVVITILGLAAILAPLVATHDPYTVDLLAARQGPSRDHWLGTDEVGRDVFSRLVYGARVSLSVGLVAVTIYTTIGVVLGAISGYFGGFVDGAIQRLTDTVMCFPTLIIIIAAVSITGPSIWNVMLIIGLLTWTGTCRLVRGQFLSLREQAFVEAARSVGASDMRLIFRHVLPNSVAPVKMRKSGPRSLSPSVGTNLALTLRVRVLTAPVKPAPFSFLVKVPMVAIVVFLFPIGPHHCDLDAGRRTEDDQPGTRQDWNNVEGGRRRLF